MESDKLNRWLTLGANLGVIVGLVLLVLEIRQNTIAVQTSALQQHFDQHTALVLARLENPRLQQALSRASEGLEGLAPEDVQYFGPYVINLFRNHFIAFELKQNGLLPDSQWNSFVTSLKGLFRRTKGARDLWHRRREAEPDEFPPEFVSFVEGVLAEIENEPPQTAI